MKLPAPIVMLLLILAMSVGSGCTAPGVAVTIKNNSGTEISNLEVKFTGGSKILAKPEAGKVFQTKIHATGESHLAVNFKDPAGETHSAVVDVYFEQSYKGSVVITIDPITKSLGQIKFTSRMAFRRRK